MKRVKYVIKLLLLLLPAVLVILPVAVLLSGAITDSYEMMEDLGPLIRKTQEFISWRFIPEYPSFSNYVKLLFRSPEFYVLFWNSVFMVGMILLGQVLVRGFRRHGALPFMRQGEAGFYFRCMWC